MSAVASPPATTPEAVDLRPAQRIIEKAGRVTAAGLIPLLQDLQEAYGWLPCAVLREVSVRTGIPASRIYGVVTFYALFYLKPRGRHTVRACRGTACHVRGSKKIIQAIQNKLGLRDGETSRDFSFSFETVACLGACALSPVVVVDKVYHGKATPRAVEDILDRMMADDAKRKEKA